MAAGRPLGSSVWLVVFLLLLLHVSTSAPLPTLHYTSTKNSFVFHPPHRNTFKFTNGVNNVKGNNIQHPLHKDTLKLIRGISNVDGNNFLHPPHQDNFKISNSTSIVNRNKFLHQSQEAKLLRNKNPLYPSHDGYFSMNQASEELLVTSTDFRFSDSRYFHSSFKSLNLSTKPSPILNTNLGESRSSQSPFKFLVLSSSNTSLVITNTNSSPASSPTSLNSTVSSSPSTKSPPNTSVSNLKTVVNNMSRTLYPFTNFHPKASRVKRTIPDGGALDKLRKGIINTVTLTGECSIKLSDVVCPGNATDAQLGCKDCSFVDFMMTICRKQLAEGYPTSDVSYQRQSFAFATNNRKPNYQCNRYVQRNQRRVKFLRRKLNQSPRCAAPIHALCPSFNPTSSAPNRLSQPRDEASTVASPASSSTSSTSTSSPAAASSAGNCLRVGVACRRLLSAPASLSSHLITQHLHDNKPLQLASCTSRCSYYLQATLDGIISALHVYSLQLLLMLLLLYHHCTILLSLAALLSMQSTTTHYNTAQATTTKYNTAQYTTT